MPGPYEPCSCGSGKNFKWCCQPIYAGINHAWELEANGQHDSAQRTMEEVTKAHGGNPEVWGQYARLLHAHNRVEDAESALDKAFAINPNYPFGLLLKAVFRLEEGERGGALLLLRKAADAYDPKAHGPLSEVYQLIFDCEQRLNNPVAARVALRLAVHFAPDAEEYRQVLDEVFGPQSRMPECARREYTFLTPPANVSGEARQAWDRALGQAITPRLGDLPCLFEPLTREQPDNAAAWFNLGLSRAWLGENRSAIEALERYLDLENDPERATTAAALVEVLHCGAGLEEDADYREHSLSVGLRNPEPVGDMLNEWAQSGRLRPLADMPQGTFGGVVLELSSTGLVTVGRPSADFGSLAGYVTIVGPVLNFVSPLKEPYERVREEVRTRLAVGLGEMNERLAPINFPDVMGQVMLFPVGRVAEGAEEKLRQHFQHYFDDTWPNQPRKSLRGNTPIDAAGHARLRKALLGIIRFLEDCARPYHVSLYDFNRLRHKLGLSAAEGAAAPAGAAPAAGAVGDIPAMSAAELAALQVEALTFEQLEQAYQAAHKLDAQELAGHFARALVSRPPQPDRPDRFPWYSYLAQRALQEGDATAALDLVNEGERVDCEQNEGKRRNDYELRRGQVHVKRGEVDQAEDVFRRLIDRVPANLRYRATAAEAMLTLRQAARALRFAEEGLTAARQANDRDSEQHLQELVSAANKRMKSEG